MAMIGMRQYGHNWPWKVIIMKKKALLLVKNALECAFKVLAKNGLFDNALRHRYAEYLVAYELSKRGHVIQLLGERDKTTADLCTDKGDLIEVKAGQCQENGFAYASFGTGGQIVNGKFRYCVFVVFEKDREGRVSDIFVFTKDELKEVKRQRLNLADHSETNPCFLVYAPSIKAYNDMIKKYKSTAFKIERELTKRPSKYRRKWGKVKK